MKFEIVTPSGEVVGWLRQATAVLIECAAIFHERGSVGELKILRSSNAGTRTQVFTYPPSDSVRDLRLRLEAL